MESTHLVLRNQTELFIRLIITFSTESTEVIWISVGFVIAYVWTLYLPWACLNMFIPV